jgi:hypothetical protein
MTPMEFKYYLLDILEKNRIRCTWIDPAKEEEVVLTPDEASSLLTNELNLKGLI